MSQNETRRHATITIDTHEAGKIEILWRDDDTVRVETKGAQDLFALELAPDHPGARLIKDGIKHTTLGLGLAKMMSPRVPLDVPATEGGVSADDLAGGR